MASISAFVAASFSLEQCIQIVQGGPAGDGCIIGVFMMMEEENASF